MAGPPILDKIKHFAPAASTLYAKLKAHGISEENGNFIPIGWDWRLGVAAAETVARIKSAVDTLTPQGKIVAIVHSTGGLVLRAFLKTLPDYAERFEQVLAFATNICGWGGDTWPLCINDGGNLVFDPPANEAGDGTVPFVSTSSLQGDKVRSMFLPIGAFVNAAIPQVHGQIWEPPVVRQLFNEVFEEAPQKPFVAAAADKDQYIDQNAAHIRVRVAATAANGAPLPNAKVTFGTGPLKQTVSLQGERRIDLDLARGIFDQHPAPSIRQTEIVVSWDGGGQAKMPVAIKIS